MSKASWMIVALGLSIAVACGKDKGSSAGAGGAAGGGACLPGTWSHKDGDTVRSFNLRADGTGDEIYSTDDVRPLTWKVKDAHTVHLVYLPHDSTVKSEFDINYDCAANTFASNYAK